jgi:hypothetical protein
MCGEAVTALKPWTTTEQPSVQSLVTEMFRLSRKLDAGIGELIKYECKTRCKDPDDPTCPVQICSDQNPEHCPTR